MASKYELNETAKHYNKAGRVYIQHDGDNYYICEGHTILMIDKYTYVAEFVYHYPKRFREIDDGVKATSEKNVFNPEGGMDVIKLMKSHGIEAWHDVRRTPLKYELKDGKEVRIYKGETPIYFNAEFDNMAVEVFKGRKYTIKGSTEKDPIIFEGTNRKFMMLPINVDSKEVVNEMMNLFN